MSYRSTNLKVSNTKGERIVAYTELKDGLVIVELPYIAAVELDNPKFAAHGIIRYTVPQKQYKKAIDNTTKYLEDLFIKELKNEYSNSSTDNGSNSGGIREEPPSGSNEELSGKDNNALYNRGGRRKQSQNNRGGNKKTDVAESGDTADS